MTDEGAKAIAEAIALGAGKIADALHAVSFAIAPLDPDEQRAGGQNIADAIRRLAAAVTPNVCGTHDAQGGHVESLTEAVMGVTAAVTAVANRSET